MVPTIDAGKPVIDLVSAGASPRPCPCRRSTAGKAVIVSPVVPTCRGPRGADDRRQQAGHRPSKRRGLPAAVPVPTIDAGKLVIGLASAGASPAAVPVVPTIDAGKLVIVPPVVSMIDAGQFQGQADGGQAGHRPGKRRGLPAAVPVPTCRGPRGADDRR